MHLAPPVQQFTIALDTAQALFLLQIWSLPVSVITPSHQTPGCILHTAHLGWSAASPWQAGIFPGPCACCWWTRSSARRPHLTLRQRRNFDKTEQLGAPAEKQDRSNCQALTQQKSIIGVRNTYSKYTSYNPSMVLPKSPSISIIWGEF